MYLSKANLPIAVHKSLQGTLNPNPEPEHGLLNCSLFRVNPNPVKNSRASRESELSCSHSHGESITARSKGKIACSAMLDQVLRRVSRCHADVNPVPCEPGPPRVNPNPNPEPEHGLLNRSLFPPFLGARAPLLHSPRRGEYEFAIQL